MISVFRRLPLDGKLDATNSWIAVVKIDDRWMVLHPVVKDGNGFSSGEDAMWVVDRYLIEQGYTLLTKEQAERLEVLV